MPSEVETGGKNVYGIPLGVLMLQSRFPRIPGDVGNASTWPFPVRYHVVAGASPDRVVRRLRDRELLGAFVDAAREVEQSGVSVLTTNCGFLALFQKEIQSAIGIPFVSSSLLQIPWLRSILRPGGQIGVLTIERASLTSDHLRAAGVGGEVPIVGMDETGGYFVDAILGDRETLDVARARQEHVEAARLLLSRHPAVSTIVLECTNMPPYARAIQQATGLPVYDITTLVGAIVAGRRRTAYSGWM